MNNRFGIKDVLMLFLLLAILVSIWIAMKQYDRQWRMMGAILEQIEQQNAAQARMERQMGQIADQLAGGVTVSDSPNGAVNAHQPVIETEDPFTRVRAARSQPEYAEGDWVVDAFSANVANLTPLISSDWYASRINALVLETLVTRDPDTLEWKPMLARDWQIEDQTEAWRAYVDMRKAEGLEETDIIEDPDCPAAVRITFQLRRGVTFSDGEPLTAEDVKYSFDLIMDERIDAPRLRNLIASKIRSVEITGPYEVVYEFKSPYFESFGMAGSLEVLPKHFYSRYSPEEINRIPGLLMGSGPYRMPSPTDWSPGEVIELVRNQRYWGELPAFEKLVYREITNEVARLTAFKNGEIDLFYRALPEQYYAMTRDEVLMERSQAFEVNRPIDGYGYMAWNQRKGDTPTRFADRRVRQAMTMLTNRGRIVEHALQGLGKISTGPFNRLSKQYDQDIEPWPYDPVRAKALLAEVGYQDRDGDGVLESTEGEPFIFTHTYPTQQGGQGFWDKVVLLLKDDYAAAGIVMELDPLEWSVFSEKLKSRDFDSISLAWSAGIEGDIYQMFHSDNIGEGADNYMSYRNSQLDVLIDKARSTVIEDERMPLWQACHRILHEDQPYTFLYVRKFLIVLDGRYRNIQKIKIGINERDEWYTPQPLQKY